MDVVRPVGWRKALRWSLFLLVAGFMSFGPCYRQALGGKGELPFGLKVDRRLFRQWVMFSGFGTDICDVRFSQRTPDGETKAVDRFELLEHPVRSKAPRTITRIKSVPRVIHLGRQLCGVLRRENPTPDLRIVARCGSREGWVEKLDGEENICELPMNWKYKEQK